MSLILISRPTYHPDTILSVNKKTGCSIDLPILGHCRPTASCSRACYAKSGPIAFPHSQKKHLWTSAYLAGPDISELIHECLSRTSVRISGSGDLNPCHIPNILKLAAACPKTQFWGMTRKLEIARAINNARRRNLRLLVTVDATSPSETWSYRGKLCYGPRRASDTVPNDPRIVTVFPYHCHGDIVANVPVHKKDCPAIRHTKSGCLECGHCWTFQTKGSK